MYIFRENITQIQERTSPDSPSEFLLFQNYPNPFNNHTTINYQIPHSDLGEYSPRVCIVIYNVLGQCIKVLFDDEQLPGEYSVSWDGMDDNGCQVASGLYFYQLTAGNRKILKKMIYLK
ncbi:hypothetical protein AMJ80_04755 [bacterium SM23_31]|nr:MAG: hypothetical protein AMJ80_04755 [bacterium SM23_31]